MIWVSSGFDVTNGAYVLLALFFIQNSEIPTLSMIDSHANIFIIGEYVTKLIFIKFDKNRIYYFFYPFPFPIRFIINSGREKNACNKDTYHHYLKQ